VLFVGVAFVLSMTIALPSKGWCGSKEKVFKIGYPQIISHPALNTIHKAFVEVMAKQGFIEGKNVEYKYRIPQSDMTVAKTIADQFVSERCDLIAPITTVCTQVVCIAAKGSGIPIVFSAVADPVLAGIVPSWEHPCSPGLKITGLSDYIPVKPQVELIKAICPKAKVLGAIFNAGDESNTKTVNEMRKLAPQYGLKMIEASVSTTADVHSAAVSLVGRADLIWWPMDNTTAAGLEGLISVCEEHKIPLFAPDIDSVKRGAIGCIYYTNYEMGKMQAQKAARVLRGEDPCNIPVSTYKSKARTIVNPAAAKRMAVTIPQSVLDSAAMVIKK